MTVSTNNDSTAASWPTEERKQRMIRLAAQLQQLGVSRHLLPELVCYDLDMVEQQLIWLPARNARKKASMIVAAIRNNYEKPANYEE